VEVVEKDVGAIESDGEQKTMSAECKRRISELDARSKEHGVGAEALLPSEDALALAHCYREAGDIAKARVWFEEAALDPKTKRRALRALRALPPK
jgi:hypothetical protein